MAVMDANAIAAEQAAATPPAGETPPAGTETPAAAGTEAPSGLPSDNEPETQTPWERAKADGFLPDDFKEDPYELAKSWKNAQNFVSDAQADKAKAGKAAEKQQALEATQTEIMSMVPEFMANDMQLTPEMETKATDLGIDIRDLKLGAIDFRDKINLAYSVVGGKEEYTQMISDMGPVMTEDQRRSFDSDLGGSASEWAIKGLHAEWKAKNGGKPAGRIEGRVGGTTGAKPYESQGEILKDLGYLRGRGKNDQAAWAQHEKRKAVTPDAVIYGR